MVYFDGICLQADKNEELHELAKLVGLSRSWYSLYPSPHYQVICHFKHMVILNYIKKQNRKYEERRGDIKRASREGEKCGAFS